MISYEIAREESIHSQIDRDGSDERESFTLNNYRDEFIWM